MGGGGGGGARRGVTIYALESHSKSRGPLNVSHFRVLRINGLRVHVGFRVEDFGF